MMKKISMFLVAAVAAGGLTACGVSDEEISACQAEGGSIVEKAFPLPDNRSWYEREETHKFTFCASSTGRIIKLYEIGAQLPADPEADFLSSEGEWTRKCTAAGGAAWKAKYGKMPYTYICVKNGEVIKTKG